MDESGIVRARLCSSYETYRIISGTSAVFVRFHSDDTNHLQGFRASFEVSGKEAIANLLVTVDCTKLDTKEKNNTSFSNMYSELPLIKTPEMWPPQYSGQSLRSQSVLCNTN